MKKGILVFFVFLVPSLFISNLQGDDFNFETRSYKSPEFAQKFALSNVVLPIGSGIILSLLVDGEASDIAGYTLLGYGAFIGPSAGNFYARDFVRGSVGIVVRLATAACVVKVGSSAVLNSAFGGSSSNSTQLLLGGSTLIFIGSMGWNVVSSSISAEEYNNKYDLSFAPLYKPNNKEFGLSLNINF